MATGSPAMNVPRAGTARRLGSGSIRASGPATSASAGSADGVMAWKAASLVYYGAGTTEALYLAHIASQPALSRHGAGR